MEKRPDSPIDKPGDNAGQDPEAVVHHVSQRKKRKKGVGGEDMDLNLTSMIDVIFQLLIYFVITANFMIDEGTILATLPGNAAESAEQQKPQTPINIFLQTGDDGRTYTIKVDNVLVAGPADLYAYFSEQIHSGKMAADDPVLINPMGYVRWQHVVNVFNACVRAELTEVGFAPS